MAVVLKGDVLNMDEFTRKARFEEALARFFETPAGKAYAERFEPDCDRLRLRLEERRYEVLFADRARGNDERARALAELIGRPRPDLPREIAGDDKRRHAFDASVDRVATETEAMTRRAIEHLTALARRKRADVETAEALGEFMTSVLGLASTVERPNEMIESLNSLVTSHAVRINNRQERMDELKERSDEGWDVGTP